MAASNLYAEGVAEPGRVRVSKVTVGALSSADVQFTTQTTKAIFNVPANTIILEVLAYTRIGWTAAVTLDVGDGTDPDLFLATAKVAPTAAQTDGLLKRMTKATAEAGAGGKLYTSADTIDVVIGGANPVVGETDFYIAYIGPVDDMNLS